MHIITAYSDRKERKDDEEGDDSGTFYQIPKVSSTTH